ncbi:EpsG family protein [Providencia huaxiensis]|uniref:EpsG family protein n=1 Tax=Providencia huaxiensis TaxID=2027290 RepID=UPI0032DB9026
MKLSLRKLTFNLFSIITISVNVVLFIPLLIYGLIKQEKSIIFYLPLFLAVISITFSPPFDFDLYRHYDGYEYYCKYNEFPLPTKDFYLYSVTHIGCTLNLPHQFIFFTTTIIYYSIVCHIITNIFNDPKFIVLNFLLSLIFIFSNNLVDISGLRYPIALAFSYLFILSIAKRKSPLKIYLFLLLSAISHFSFIILLPLYLLYKVSLNIINGKNGILLVITCLLVGLFLIQPITGALILLIQDWSGIYIGAEVYTTGEWGSDRLTLQGYNSNGVLVEKFNLYYNIFVISTLSIFFSVSLPVKTRVYRLFIIVTSVSFLFVSFDTIYFRYQSIILFIALIMLYESRTLISKKNMLFILILLISKYTLQYSLGLRSNYTLFLLDILSEKNLFKLSGIAQILS